VTTDTAKRVEMYTRVQRLIAEQVPFLFIAYADLFAVARTQVQGFVLSSTRTMTPLAETWLSR
jgi:ABC-type transport system substrate-binding protein